MDIVKRILLKEILDKPIAGQGSEITPFITLMKEKETKQKSAMFSEKSVINNKIVRLTFLLGKLATQANQIDKPDPSNPECTKVEVDPSITLEGQTRIIMTGIRIKAKRIRNVTLS